jgi:hypothetical protein
VSVVPGLFLRAAVDADERRPVAQSAGRFLPKGREPYEGGRRIAASTLTRLVSRGRPTAAPDSQGFRARPRPTAPTARSGSSATASERFCTGPCADLSAPERIRRTEAGPIPRFPSQLALGRG